ncbi:MAG: hypothetical protein ACE5HE_04160 [Phycisphaerae bacterium]
MIVPLWLASIGWLVAHDVWPGWAASDAPTLRVTDWLKQAGKRAQFTIHNSMGPVGTVWTDYFLDEESIQREDTILISDSGLRSLFPLRMIISSVYTADGTLDEFTVRMDNYHGSVRLHGERFPSDFSFTLETPTVFRAFKIPLTDGRIISGGFNPFAQIADVHVGQRWRMQMFNPVAALTGLGSRFIPMVVAVTAKETIAPHGSPIECFIVEAADAKAWVDLNGAVQEQVVTLPVLGTMRIVREQGYDEEACRAVRRGHFPTAARGRHP